MTVIAFHIGNVEVLCGDPMCESGRITGFNFSQSPTSSQALSVSHVEYVRGKIPRVNNGLWRAGLTSERPPPNTIFSAINYSFISNQTRLAYHQCKVVCGVGIPWTIPDALDASYLNILAYILRCPMPWYLTLFLDRTLLPLWKYQQMWTVLWTETWLIW